jgi:hypothetical protein
VLLDVEVTVRATENVSVRLGLELPDSVTVWDGAEAEKVWMAVVEAVRVSTREALAVQLKLREREMEGRGVQLAVPLVVREGLGVLEGVNELRVAIVLLGIIDTVLVSVATLEAETLRVSVREAVAEKVSVRVGGTVTGRVIVGVFETVAVRVDTVSVGDVLRE